MTQHHMTLIAGELKVQPQQVLATVELLDDGSTIPFIARYRKERTGGLDEVALAAIRDRLEQLRELDKRREAVVKSLQEQGVLTPELQAAVDGAPTMAILEDLYLPYRPKRRTRATAAREKGLEPLAQKIFAQDGAVDPVVEAAAFVNVELGVTTGDEALAGARDIIAEWVTEHADLRREMRTLFLEKGTITSKVVKGKEQEGQKYQDYFDANEPLKRAPSHRLLAVFRGADEGFLTFTIRPDEAQALSLVERTVLKGTGPATEQVKTAAHDAYQRLLANSMETEARQHAKARADEKASAVVADNLRELLLASPLGQRRVLAIDPGLRTGCKVICLDAQGKLLLHDVIHPLPPQNKTAEAADWLQKVCQKLDIEFIAVGSGTGGRETLSFCRGITFHKPIPVILVNESGASVYSASKVAREEFPDHDVTVRGAVSIGRRLQDPLAELVKVDPKAIGVGQYQHDVNQKSLRKALDDVVVSCVNAVGVEVNTASKQLLAYVSGLGPKLAANVVAFRNEHGAFSSRQVLKQIPGMGPKSFEQSAGFLRIRDGRNPLDGSAVHPESYEVVERMAADLGCSVADLIQRPELRETIDLTRYVTDDVGLPTLTDILTELAKPGRDPRKEFAVFTFAEGVNTIADLKVGMELPGIVTNVTAFGAFVDVGVHQDGLVHISQLAERRVTDPTEVVKVMQQVKVKVMEVDLERHRISLSMRENPEAPLPGRRHPRPERPAEGGERREGRPRRDRKGPPPHRQGDERKPRPEGEPRKPHPEGSDRRPRPEGSDRRPRPEGGDRRPRPEGGDRRPRREDDDRRKHPPKGPDRRDRPPAKKKDNRPELNENPFYEALKDWKP